MIRFPISSYPMQLTAVLPRRAGVWLGVLLLSPAGLAGQETRQVTLYTPSGSQQRTLGTPMVVDVGLPSPVTAPVSEVTGTGTGTQVTVETAVSEGAGGQAATSYADDPIWAMAADTSGNVWVGTSAGLSRFDGQQWTTFTQADGLADDHIRSVAVDGQGRVWAGSDSGVTRFDGQRWTRYRLGGAAQYIAVAPNGNVWCGGYVGLSASRLYRFDGQTWRRYDNADMGIEGRGDVTSLNALAVDGSGTLWAYFNFYEETMGGLGDLVGSALLTFDGRQWRSYQFDRGVGVIFADSQGRVWVSSDGLYVKESSTWKRYAQTGTGDERRWYVSDMAEDSADRLWISEGGYFGVLQGTTWTGFPYGQFHTYGYGDAGGMVIDSRGICGSPRSTASTGGPGRISPRPSSPRRLPASRARSSWSRTTPTPSTRGPASASVSSSSPKWRCRCSTPAARGWPPWSRALGRRGATRLSGTDGTATAGRWPAACTSTSCTPGTGRRPVR